MRFFKINFFLCSENLIKIMSQEVYTKKKGVHGNNLARIENGNNFVSSETLENIKNVLNIEYKDLFIFDKEEKTNPKKALEARFQELNEIDAKYFLTCIENYLKAKRKNSKNN